MIPLWVPDVRDYSSRAWGMDRAAPLQNGPNTILSRILQVALGLFVTTYDLPPLPANHESLSYDCSFDADCRWFSVGDHVDRWRIARGEPDSILWLAATGTMQIPREPFALIESRGHPVDALMTDGVRCQKGFADLSFIYWAIGQADIEICLTDEMGHKFNCTGMLNSRIMPGKVALKIPEMQKPFRIMISPNNQPGVIVLDDIRYDASTCEATIWPPIRGKPDLMTTSTPIVLPWTMRKTSTGSPFTTIETTTTTMSTTTEPEPESTTTELITEPPIPTTFPTPEPSTEQPSVITVDRLGTTLVPSTTTDIPFDLMIYGNKTSPLFDRRTGMIINESTKLLCGFNDEFACQWGAEAGRWAVIQQGAIPSLEESVADPELLPLYPAALVLQGSAMLTSDPIRCQTGSGKVLFRYWSNGDILLQVCALGYGIDSDVLVCVDQSRPTKHQRHNLAVFEINQTIRESFTLNIVPQWEPGVKNRYLVIDEIAYIGECSASGMSKGSGRPVTLPTPPPAEVLITTSTKTTTMSTTTTATTTTPTPTTTVPTTTEDFIISARTTTQPKVHPWQPRGGSSRPYPWLVTLPPIFPSKLVTKEPYTKKRPYSRTIPPPTPSPVTPILPDLNGRKTTNRWVIQTTTNEPPVEDYCQMLNCNFDDNACNYLNHGLTKKPWTLRNRGYGYPLTGSSDIRPTGSNGQFVSTLLDPGDIAILESPKFNSTKSLNVLLFQYYRPAQLTTIRLCLGSRYTNPLRSVSSFMQCPSILRSVSSRNAYRWNTVHVQLPSGTTHFYLVAHNSDRSETRSALAIDNMRVAICDPRGFAPEYIDEMTEGELFQEYDNA